MSKKYRISEAQLTKIYESLNQVNEGVDKFDGKSINPSAGGAKEWEKISKPGSQVKDSLKSGGAAKNIEGSSAKKGEWEKISVPQSPEAKKHVVSMKAGEIKKTSDGVSKTSTAAVPEKKQAPESKENIKGGLKNSSKANTKATETKDPVVKESSLAPSQMRHKKTDEIAEAAKKLDMLSGKDSKKVEVKTKNPDGKK